MEDKLTTFDEFKKRKAQRGEHERARDTTERAEAARDAYRDLEALLDETARLVRALDGGLRRDLAKAIASGDIADADAVAELVRGYERLSWRLYGQLRHIQGASRRR